MLLRGSVFFHVYNLPGGAHNSTKKGVRKKTGGNPIYFRPYIGTITPFTTIVGAHRVNVWSIFNPGIEWLIWRLDTICIMFHCLVAWATHLKIWLSNWIHFRKKIGMNTKKETITPQMIVDRCWWHFLYFNSFPWDVFHEEIISFQGPRKKRERERESSGQYNMPSNAYKG